MEKNAENYFIIVIRIETFGQSANGKASAKTNGVSGEPKQSERERSQRTPVQLNLELLCNEMYGGH